METSNIKRKTGSFDQRTCCKTKFHPDKKITRRCKILNVTAVEGDIKGWSEYDSCCFLLYIHRSLRKRLKSPFCEEFSVKIICFKT